MKKKRQHTVPKFYLKAWCDPTIPAGHKPIVWVVSKDGENRRQLSPKSLFTQDDMYTITTRDGKRELVVEDTLQKVESKFAEVVEKKIKNGIGLSGDDRKAVDAFIAAMSTRTKLQKVNFTKSFQEIHDMVEALEKQHHLPPRQSEQTKYMADHAQQKLIGDVLSIMPPILSRMSLAIFETADTDGFITSDEPCVWFNPELYKVPPFYRHPGLGQKKIEVTLPVTPNHLLFYSWVPSLQGYCKIPLHIVDELNRRTRGHCNESFISWKGGVKPIWLDDGKLPDDAWEKTHIKTPLKPPPAMS